MHDSSTIPVGAALSLTGAAGSYGTSQQKGLELAAEQLNAKGGVKYDVKIEDDQTDPRQGITVFEGFVNGGKSVIIGPTLSNTAFQAQPIAQEGKTPVLAVSNTASGITRRATSSSVTRSPRRRSSRRRSRRPRRSTT